jgi:hypothetical protein
MDRDKRGDSGNRNKKPETVKISAGLVKEETPNDDDYVSLCWNTLNITYLRSKKQS